MSTYQIRLGTFGVALYEAETPGEALVKFARDRAVADAKRKVASFGDRAELMIGTDLYEAVSALQEEAGAAA